MNLKNKLSKQAEQKQNHRHGDHLKVYQLGGGRREWEKRCGDEEVQISRYRLVRGVLRAVKEMEKPENLHV